MVSRAAAGNAPAAQGGRVAGFSGALAAPVQEKGAEWWRALPRGSPGLLTGTGPVSQRNMEELQHRDPRPSAGHAPGLRPSWKSSAVISGQAQALSRTQQPGAFPWKIHSRAAG